jgi:transposase
MAHLYHANAKTTVKIRQEIKQSTETIKALSKKYNLNPKTILKWKHAASLLDKKSGPTNPRSSVLNALEEQIICEFRRVTKLPLDDVYISLKGKIKKLTRSNLYRCLKRHGLNRLPRRKTQPKPEKKTFADYKIGYVHVDVTHVRLLNKGKYYIFVGIERVSKYVYVEIHDNMRIKTACEFLQNLIGDCPFKIHRLLTDNGISFTYRLMKRKRAPKRKHSFDKVCAENGIKHKLTKS